MSLEKKLGMAFVGILFLTFCGVLTMRLTGVGDDEKIDINVAGLTPNGEPAPNSGPRTPDVPQKPTLLAERRDPPAARPFANSGTGTSSPSAATASSPYGATSPTQMPSSSAVPSNRYATDNRYAPPATSSPAGGYANLTSPPAAQAMPSSNTGLAGSAPPPMVASAPSVVAVPPSAAMPTSGTAANPLRSSTPPPSATASPSPFATSSSPPTVAISGSSSTAADNRYAAPNIASAPSTSASPTVAVPREPRPFDASAAVPQPMAISPSPVATSSPSSPVGVPGAPYAASPGVAALAPPAARGSLAGGTTTAPSNVATASVAPRESAVPNLATPPIAATAGAVAPASAVVPVASGRDQPYVVAPGDTLLSISQKVYGDGSLYRALFAYNSDRYPHAEDVRSGNVLDVPPAEYLRERYPELIGGPATADTAALREPGRTAVSGSTYVVREGDTLFDIARKQLGQASRWTELYEANRAVLGENLENLRPGVTLRLP